jgi:hypothetical protein
VRVGDDYESEEENKREVVREDIQENLSMTNEKEVSMSNYTVQTTQYHTPHTTPHNTTPHNTTLHHSTFFCKVFIKIELIQCRRCRLSHGRREGSWGQAGHRTFELRGYEGQGLVWDAKCFVEFLEEREGIMLRSKDEGGCIGGWRKR